MTTTTRRLTAALLALGLCGEGAACKKSGDSGAQSLVELRPVVASNPPPCTQKASKGGKVLPKTTDGKVTECLQVGKPIIDAKDVRSATVAETPSREPALSLVVGGVGSANLDGFAQRNQGKRLAIVADGVLVSAPVLQFPPGIHSFDGRIQVTGLSKEKTDDMFRRLNKLIKPH
jgi:preprotein translocase subunit SecD